MDTPGARGGSEPDRWVTTIIIVLAGLVAVGAFAGWMLLGRRTAHLADGHAEKQRATREQLRQVDESLVQWEQVEAIDLAGTSKYTPTGIAVAPDGGFYVTSDEGLDGLSADRQVRPPVALPGDARCVALDQAPGGSVAYVGLTDRVAVVGGGRVELWDALDGRALITSIAVAGDGVWVADAGNRRLLKFNRAGKMLVELGAGSGDEFVLPSPHLDIAIGPDGAVWVNNPGKHEVQRRSADGALETTWGFAGSGIEGFTGCCNPTDICILPDGRVATSEKGLPRVKVLEPDGALESVVAPPEDLAKRAAGIDLACDAEGRLFVLDRFARRMLVYQRKGDRKVE